MRVPATARLLATPETLDIMAERYGLAFAEAKQGAAYVRGGDPRRGSR